MPKKNRLITYLGGGKFNSLGAVLVASLVCVPPCVHAAAVPSGINSFRLPPVRFNLYTSGNLSYRFSHQRSTFGQSSTIQSAGLAVNSKLVAQSYFWRPWFAPVKSSLGLSLNNTRYTGSGGNSTDFAVDGGVFLELVPASSFPFSAELSRRKSWQRSGSKALAVRNIVTNLRLVQGFRNSDRLTSGNVSYFSVSEDTPIARVSVQDKFAFQLSHRPDPFQRLAGTAHVERRRSPLLKFRSLERALVLDHRFNTLGITGATFFNINSGVFSQQAAAPSSYESRQINSVWNWYPLGEIWSIYGSANLRNSIRNNASSANATSLALGSQYSISPNIRVRGSIKASDSKGKQTIAANASLTSNKKFSDITTLSGYTYKKYASFSLATQGESNSTGISNNSQSITASVGHSLSKSTTLLQGKLTSSINQSISSSVSTGSTTPTIPLTTGGVMGWNRQEKDSGSRTTLYLNAVDVRQLGKSDHSQTYNLQAVRKQAMARYQSLSGNISMSRYSSSSLSSRDHRYSISAIYGHTRLFRVKNLTLTSALKLEGGNQLSQNSYGYGQSGGDTLSWDNEFDYLVGELELALDTHLVKYSQLTYFSLLFTAKRSF
jgi:hypothetical protein